MLLRYLATSHVRRDLLGLLWADGVEGSVSDLSRRALASYPATHRELEAMRAADLVTSKRSGATVVYRANPAFAQADLLRRLVLDADTPESAPDDERSDQVRGWLAGLGAPLVVRSSPASPAPPAEEVVALGLELSHRDGHVATVMPALLWRQHQHLNRAELVHRAGQKNERQTLGFFLELTGLLSGERSLVAEARPLRDKRRRAPHPFFALDRNPRALELARDATPPLARKWGYLMNLDMETFRSAFAKHTAADDRPGVGTPVGQADEV